MAINEREHHIKTLENLLKEIKGKIELYSENENIDLTKEKDVAETLAYAISSLKTDLKYDLMYEEEVIYTKADMVAILTELQLDIEKHTMTSGVTNQGTWNECIACCSRIIQQKINAIKETKR